MYIGFIGINLSQEFFFLHFNLKKKKMKDDDALEN